MLKFHIQHSTQAKTNPFDKSSIIQRPGLLFHNKRSTNHPIEKVMLVVIIKIKLKSGKGKFERKK